jgi:hypothetical protein
VPELLPKFEELGISMADIRGKFDGQKMPENIVCKKLFYCRTGL